MGRVAVEPQRGLLQGLWCLPTCMFLAVVAVFPWQIQAQTPCPKALQCVPTGVLTVTFSVSGDTSGCVFNATVHWGDGASTTVAHIVDGQTMTHTYAVAGIYTVHIMGSGTPTGPDALCTSTPHTILTVQTHVPGVR
jgi:hypothetical protein